MDNRPIGVFDSGLGGLTVFKEITAHLPGESVIYFGDSARAPYGTKSRETIIKYTLQNVRFLLSHDIKMLVMACNTMSAFSYERIKMSFDIPVIEVIGAGAVTAVLQTKNRKIGVIGTTATINSRVYETAISRLDNTVEIYQKACPLFVPLVEEGREWWDNDIAVRIAENYLLPLKQEGIDTLVLGCTHYPLLQKTISAVMGDVKLVSSALEVARVVKNMVMENNMHRDPRYKPVYRYYTSDSVEKFEQLCSVILGRAVSSAEKIDIEKY